MFVLKVLFGGSLQITSENQNDFKGKKWSQMILRVAWTLAPQHSHVAEEQGVADWTNRESAGRRSYGRKRAFLFVEHASKSSPGGAPEGAIILRHPFVNASQVPFLTLRLATREGYPVKHRLNAVSKRAF